MVKVSELEGAEYSQGELMAGPTPLIAAMRAYVAEVYGDEVPNEA
jgi:hypothetical protein